jgi:hypothetical protein
MFEKRTLQIEDLPLCQSGLLRYQLRHCYDLNFAVNRKGENVLEHSRTGSRTPTSGTGRVKSARGGEKDIKVEPTP